MNKLTTVSYIHRELQLSDVYTVRCFVCRHITDFFAKLSGTLKPAKRKPLHKNVFFR